MVFHYRAAATDQEKEAFFALRMDSLHGRGGPQKIEGPGHSEKDFRPGTHFFLAFDDKEQVVGGLRVVVQAVDDARSLPTEQHLGVDIERMLGEKGVVLRGRKICDLSGIHVAERLRKDPAAVINFMHHVFDYAKSQGAEICMAAPTEPVDVLVKRMLKHHGIPYAELGSYKMDVLGKEERKQLMIFTDNPEILLHKDLVAR